MVGKKCGYMTTVSFFDGETEHINKHGLSMPGGWLLQKQLRQMLDRGCKYAIVECTSEGLAQNRHLGINFDMAVFTNLSEAHLETHGGVNSYRKAKARLFEAISNFQLPTSKQIQNSEIQIPKSIIVNGDDENAEYFLSFPAQRKLSVGVSPAVLGEDTEKLTIENLNIDDQSFKLGAARFEVKLLGAFNIQNVALAAAAAFALGVPVTQSAQAISSFDKIRGRMEAVPNSRGITIIVDYGCEPASFEAALQAATVLPHNRLIHVFGSTGGHRDKQKRLLFGQTAARYADEIIITNDDVYDSDPEEIVGNILQGVKSQESKVKSYEIILNRREAIHQALKIAQSGDLVLITGKGSEQFLVLPEGKRIEWDEVEVVKQELTKLTPYNKFTGQA